MVLDVVPQNIRVTCTGRKFGPGPGPGRVEAVIPGIGTTRPICHAVVALSRQVVSISVISPRSSMNLGTAAMMSGALVMTGTASSATVELCEAAAEPMTARLLVVSWRVGARRTGPSRRRRRRRSARARWARWPCARNAASEALTTRTSPAQSGPIDAKWPPRLTVEIRHGLTDGIVV